MADQPEKSNSNSSLAFIVGALVVAVTVLAYVVMGDNAGSDDTVTINVEGATDAVESAAEAVEDGAEAVEDAASN